MVPSLEARGPGGCAGSPELSCWMIHLKCAVFVLSSGVPTLSGQSGAELFMAGETSMRNWLAVRVTTAASAGAEVATDVTSAAVGSASAATIAMQTVTTEKASGRLRVDMVSLIRPKGAACKTSSGTAALRGYELWREG